MNATCGIKGRVIVEHYDNYDQLIERREFNNLFLNVGKAQVVGLLINSGGSYPTHIGVGTGTTAESAMDTALEAEVMREAISDYSITTTDVTNDTATFETTISFSDSYAITEYGLFDAASAGNLFARKVQTAIDVSDGNSLKITWNLQVQNG